MHIVKTPGVTLGKQYQDSLTGFIGTATCRTTYLYGCVRVNLEGLQDGKVITEMYFDEQRLTEYDTGQPVLSDANSGGNYPNPPTR
jgi:hypothetical protein